MAIVGDFRCAIRRRLAARQSHYNKCKLVRPHARSMAFQGVELFLANLMNETEQFNVSRTYEQISAQYYYLPITISSVVTSG